MPLLTALDGGLKRAFSLWHRRGGKDITLWNYTIKKAFEKVGVYFYLLPTYTQAKKIIWDGINNDGFKFIDYIPEQLIVLKSSQELKIVLKNGSIIQLIGTDDYDRIRGTNPMGCVFSEYAFHNPMAWEVVKPILRANGGWAVFNTTPNGKNHAYDMYQMAKNNLDWFCDVITVADTNVVSEKDIQDERLEGMSEEMIQQEYYCSFEIGTLGNYYVNYIRDMEKDNRICGVPIENHLETDVWMDLGRTDATAVGFFQRLGKEIRMIDYYEHTGESVGHYVQLLKSKGYLYGALYLPHDAFHKRMEANKSIADQFAEAGFKVKRVPSATIQNGIQQVRKIFPRLWIDKERCSQAIRALEDYHKEYDQVNKIFKDKPLHNWSSHTNDMFRYMSLCVDDNNLNKNFSFKISSKTDSQHKYKTLKIKT